MRGSAPRPAGGNNFPRTPLICPLRMPKGGRRKGPRVRPSAHPPFPAPPLPSTLRHHSPHPVPSSLRRMGALVRRLRGHVPNGCPSPRLLRSPSPRFRVFPLFITFLGCSRSPASAIPHPRHSPSRLSAAPLLLPSPLSSRHLSAVSRPSARIPRRAVVPHSRLALLLRHARPSARPTR